MKICGIVAEYNPFHNGHKHHVARSRELGATHVVAVMSGSFTQRAETAVLPKFERAKAAALGGVDLVIELPVPWAIASAERFAFGAVSILSSLGCVETLSFGSECGDIAALKTAKDAMSDRKIQKRTSELMELGDSYPVAREKAFEVFYPDLIETIEQPNNSLGIEYLKALDALASGIEPQTITRRGAGHDDSAPVAGYASASYIRNLIMDDADTSGFVPQSTFKVIYDARNTGRLSYGLGYAEAAVLYKLRMMSREDFLALPDCETGLGDRLFAASLLASSLAELCELAKTKRYTMSRVRRTVLAAFLGIDYSAYDFPPPYVRILAIGDRGEEILSLMDKRCVLPVSQSLQVLGENSPECERVASLEARATDIFNLTLFPRGPKNEDMTKKLFKTDVPEKVLEEMTKPLWGAQEITNDDDKPKTDRAGGSKNGKDA